MANVSDVEILVREYEKSYRHPNLESFKFVEKFDLKVADPICPPLAAKKGVYVILNGDKVIYIGKSSAQKKAIWHRIVDHFYSSKRKQWASEATHFFGWAVPDENFFEATALDEYLIFKLREDLPFNKVGK